MYRTIMGSACLAVGLSACGGGGNNSGALGDVVAVTPAKASSQYAEVLADCSYGENVDPCSLNTLPLIGQEYGSPGIEQVMDRVVVSHPWMGQRFRELLNFLPRDLLTLLKPVTAIVIASDVRPSFYWSFTGAMYLDPEVLWLTVAERDTIEQDEDPRVGFGSELNYRAFWRTVKDNEYAYEGTDYNAPNGRNIQDIQYAVAGLLYHELAHANDFFPPGSLTNLSRDQSVFAASRQLEPQQLSSRLRRDAPLQSALQFDLAEVNFAGRSASNQEKSLTPLQVADDFALDAANDDYNYFTQFEDLAMLFEETMLRRHFDVRRDYAIVRIPAQDNPAANDFIVEWGQRSRIGDANVRQRAQQAAEMILPSGQFAAFFASLPPPQALRRNVGWIDNLDPSGTSSRPKVAFTRDPALDQRRTDAPAR